MSLRGPYKGLLKFEENRTFLDFLKAHHVRYMSATSPLHFFEEK